MPRHLVDPPVGPEQDPELKSAKETREIHFYQAVHVVYTEVLKKMQGIYSFIDK